MNHTDPTGEATQAPATASAYEGASVDQPDPTAVEMTSGEAVAREVSVEETAQLLAEEAANAAIGPSGVEIARAEAPISPQPVPERPRPVVPIPLPLRAVSGRYRSPSAGYQLELRVDVDGRRPMNRISGDFYQISGATTTYFGSFVVHSPSISVTPGTVTIRGLGQFTFAAGAPVVQVTIPRRLILQPPAPATVQFFRTTGAPGATYNCPFESVYFRSVRLETDCVSDVTTPVFSSYNTGSLPSGGPARTLSVVNAYAEAGIQMLPTAGTNIINIGEAGDARWSDAELHASMERHFTLWRDLPQWAVWLLVAQLHEYGPGLLGIMFDQRGRQRQGCAVFHAGLGGTTPQRLREQLFTYVHELGHCFNLLHSWQKALATPPGVNRPNSLSWMNYPWRYPLGGEAAFWAAFPFQFDDDELIHLRHAFRNQIVMGGNDFAVGSGLEDTAFLATPVRDNSGLRLEISAPRSVALGEPVVVKLALSAADGGPRTVHPYLHPNLGVVQIAIRKPDGRVLVYDPVIDHCVGQATTTVTAADVIEDSAYIGYGHDGFYFDQAGTYQIRAIYPALDGSQVASNILTLRVRHPVTAAEDELADLFLGEAQGMLLYLLGSDAESLASGTKAFEEVLARHGKHPMANYARLVLGVNAAREFKLVTPETETGLAVRKPKPEESAQLLSAVVQSGLLDPITQDMAATRLADCQARLGDEKAAAETRDKLARKAARRAAAAAR